MGSQKPLKTKLYPPTKPKSYSRKRRELLLSEFQNQSETFGESIVFNVLDPFYTVGATKYYPKEFIIPFRVYRTKKFKRNVAKKNYLLAVHAYKAIEHREEEVYEEYRKYLKRMIRLFKKQVLLKEKEIKVSERRQRLFIGYTSGLRRRSTDIRNRFLFNPEREEPSGL